MTSSLYLLSFCYFYSYSLYRIYFSNAYLLILSSYLSYFYFASFNCN